MYDLIIVGDGPAGLTAAIYAARYKLKTLCVCKEPGGTITEASKVENFPGFQSISGYDLMQKIIEQAKALGVEMVMDAVINIKKNGNFLINDKYESKTILISVGTARRRLNIPGEKEFAGKGVSFCFTCDAPFFKDKIVGVVGGSDSAAMAAELLSEYAQKVHIFYRKAKLRAEPILVEHLEKDSKIEIVANTNVKEIHGDKVVTSVILDNSSEFKLDGLFIEIGSDPRNELAKMLNLELDEEGYIVVDAAQKTSMDGVYAAGDITTNSNMLRQMIVACSEGAIAAASIYQELKNR